MAIQWGPTVGNFRLGIDIQVGTSSITWFLYGQSVRYGHNWNYTINFTGTWGSGTKTGHFSSAHNQTKTVLLHRTTGSLRSYNNGATLTSVLVPGASVSRSYSYSPPPSSPSAPSGLTAVRQSDSVITLNWTRNSTYTKVRVDRALNLGTWKTVATIQGNAYTWTDRSTIYNQLYQYRVVGYNAGGQSGVSNTASAYTTPAPPQDLSAVKTSNGDIRVSAGWEPQWATSYDVEDNGTVVATSVQLPWTHTTPAGAVPHTYRVRSKRGSLISDWSEVSNTVQILARPAAPTGLAPNGGVRVADEDVRFAWLHNPVDSSEQTAFEVEYRELGGSWQTVSGSVDGNVAVALDASEYEWRVRTKGAHPDWSDWSSIATVDVIDRPGVVIVEPADQATVDYSVLDLGWSFAQAQDFPQSAWRVELLDDEGTVLESRTGDGQTGNVVFRRRLEDATTYAVRVQAAAGGIWSDWDEATFTTDFPLPGVPDVNVSWDDDRGTHVIVFEDTEGETATVEMLVERSFDGDSWILISDGHEPGEHAVEDYEGASNGATLYRVTAVSGLPSTAESVFVAESDSGAVWLSGGPEFTTVCRLPFNPQPSRNTGRETTLRYYSGRSKPVVYKGKQLSRVVDLAGDVLYEDDETASYEELEELVHLPDELHLYRDPDGQRMYGALSEVSLSRQSHEHWSYSASITEADR